MYILNSRYLLLAPAPAPAPGSEWRTAHAVEEHVHGNPVNVNATCRRVDELKQLKSK